MTTTELTEAYNKLQRFKDFVHRRLDDAGVPYDPKPEKTADTGCRIGNRLDYVFSRCPSFNKDAK